MLFRSGGRAGAKYLPARMLAGDGGNRFWASRLVDLAAALAADTAPRSRNLYNYCDYADDPFRMTGGAVGGDYGLFDAFGSDDDYFWDE